MVVSNECNENKAKRRGTRIGGGIIVHILGEPGKLDVEGGTISVPTLWQKSSHEVYMDAFKISQNHCGEVGPFILIWADEKLDSGTLGNFLKHHKGGKKWSWFLKTGLPTKLSNFFKRPARHLSWAKDRLTREVTGAETLLCEVKGKMTSPGRYLHGNIILCMWASFEVSHSSSRAKSASG